MHRGNLKTIFNKNKLINSRILGLIGLLIGSYFSPLNHPQNPNISFLIETTDHVIVVKNNTVIFEYLEQADIEDPVQIRVIETPKFGKVQLNEDQSFGYTPSPDLCEKEDQFTYLLTTNETSMKVVVSIEILCESLTIFNGITSDEKDNKLENFRILGVENYPNNVLHIFDSQGEQIFELNGYRNNWNGQIVSTEHLTKENLYYYVFNDGQGNYYSGYLVKN